MRLLLWSTQYTDVYALAPSLPTSLPVGLVGWLGGQADIEQRAINPAKAGLNPYRMKSRRMLVRDEIQVNLSCILVNEKRFKYNGTVQERIY